MMIRNLLIAALPLLFVTQTHSQTIECSKPYEQDCPEDPFEEGDCSEQECIEAPFNPPAQFRCDWPSAESEYKTNGKYHAGLEEIYDPNEPGHFYWNHGTTWCVKTKSCLLGTDCKPGQNGKKYCKSDPNASWEYDEELEYTGAGDPYVITEM